VTSPDHRIDPQARACELTEFFGPRVPGQPGCVFDHAGHDLVIGHIDVTENLIAGTPQVLGSSPRGYERRPWSAHLTRAF
jgi:hypothetical protein